MTRLKKGNTRLFAVIGSLVIIGTFRMVWNNTELLNVPPATTIPSAPANPSPVESTSTAHPFVTLENSSRAAVSPVLTAPIPSPTAILPTLTPESTCNQIGSIVDVTIPAGSQIVAGQAFTKTWGFQNTGSCTWTSDYRLVRTSVSLVVPNESISLGGSISPGTVGQVSVEVTAPQAAGEYNDSWMLFDPNGQAVKDEVGREVVFTTAITVVAPTPTPEIPCNQVSSVADISIPAGSQIAAGQTFYKTWSFQNTGSCTWTSDYMLVRTSGSLIVPNEWVSLGGSISPGSVGQLSVEVTAPQAAGEYNDSWMLFDLNGQALTEKNGREAVFSIAITIVSPTPTPLPKGRISGMIVKDGAAASGVNLSLESLSNQTIATAVTAADGTFTWKDLPANDQGYNIVFSQAGHEQYGVDQVLSWAWAGPVPVHDGDVIELPDMDISMLGFSQISPNMNSVYSAAAITQSTPVFFQWMDYPGATDYWVDLVRGEEQTPAWQSKLVQTTSAAFGGTLLDGTRIQAGEYWWAAGAQRAMGSYTQTVYTYLVGFIVEE